MKFGLVLLAALSMVAPAQSQTPPDIEQIVISVKDLARSETIYTSVMGFHEVSHGDGASPELQRLWNLAPGVGLKWALLEKPEAPASVHIRLVQFSPESPRARYEYREQDAGIADMHICVLDVLAAYKTLSEQGFTSLHEPVLWHGRGGELGEGPSAWYEAFMHGLDGEGITLIPRDLRPGCKDYPVGSTPFGPLRNFTISVSSIDRAYVFYHGELGWGKTDIRYESFGPEMEAMLRLPRGTVAKALHFGAPPVPWLTLTEFAGATRIDLSERNSPPSRGQVVMTFKVRDAKQWFDAFQAAAANIVCGLETIPDSPYNGAPSFSLKGPDGVFFEFVQR